MTCESELLRSKSDRPPQVGARKYAVKVFLSCVSSEFQSYRLKHANQLGTLKGQPYEVKVPEDFEQGG
jgi:hypothetical protein